MNLLEERIRRDGIVREDGVLRVDSFLNHQIDVTLLEAMGKEFARLFQGENINKILTIEASGIAIAYAAAKEFGCPLVFAKKNKTRNLPTDVWTSTVRSFTTGKDYDIMVSRDYLTEKDRVLIVDDFLAMGSALSALITMVEDAGATCVGAGIAIEKAFQPGGELIRSRGVRVESLARIASMGSDNNSIVFC